MDAPPVRRAPLGAPTTSAGGSGQEPYLHTGQPGLRWYANLLDRRSGCPIFSEMTVVPGNSTVWLWSRLRGREAEACQSRGPRSRPTFPVLLALALLPALHESLLAQAIPDPRAHHQLVYHAGEQRVYLLGGSTPRGEGHHFFDDIWSWDGERWQRIGSLPFPRSSHRVVHHSSRNTIVLFGGGSGRAFTADSVFWEWDRAAWSPLGQSPRGGLAEPGMCHDRKRSRIVLFGGWDGANRYNGETWEWTGEALMNVDVTGPSARAGHAFVYDPNRKTCLLFGGRGEDGVLSDTWEWDGTGWRRFETSGPSARWISGAASDDANERVVLFSGWAEDETALGDTWAWDGESWELISTDGPAPRISSQLAFDGTGILLFGGRSRMADGFQDLNDTWRLVERGWVRMR